MRLQKFLARAGVASRRGSETLMSAGRVTVNGIVVTKLGAKIDPTCDVVAVDGVVVRLGDAPIHLMLHKPAGFLTTMNDPLHRPSVRELIPTQFPGLFPVGRLDKDTTGLLLFTTDGELGFRLLHPRFHVEKSYLAKVEGLVVEDALDSLREGIELDDGPTRPATVMVLATAEDHSHVKITISEGRKRQVRRMFSAIGYPVLSLHRVSFGPISLDDLPEGEWRHLSSSEIDALRELIAEGKEV